MRRSKAILEVGVVGREGASTAEKAREVVEVVLNEVAREVVLDQVAVARAVGGDDQAVSRAMSVVDAVAVGVGAAVEVLRVGAAATGVADEAKERAYRGEQDA